MGYPYFWKHPFVAQTASASTTHVPSTNAGFLSSASDPDGGRDEGENSGDGVVGVVVFFRGWDLGFVEKVMGFTGWWFQIFFYFQPENLGKMNPF